MEQSLPGKCLGIIGGLGVGATVHYYRELVRAWEVEGASPRVLMAHADVRQTLALVQAGRLQDLALYLAELLRQLQAGGAEIAAIPSVTTHACIDELTRISPLPLINLLDVIRQEIAARTLRRVAIYGTRFTVETRIFGALREIEIVEFQPGELQYVHDTYMQMALAGVATEAQHEGLTALARTLVERDGAEAILLAGTDLALAFHEGNTPFPHLDCAGVHIREIVRAMRG